MNNKDQIALINLLTLVVISFLVFSCESAGQQSTSQEQEVDSYPVLNLEPRSITLTQSYPATLEGLQTVEIRPRLQGYIVAMPVDEGDIVEKGEVLFRLNNEQYQQEVRSAKADIEVAQAAVNTAEDEVQRLTQLAEKDIISDYKLQSAKNTLASEKAALSQARTRLENAQVNLEYTYIKSPTDGVIGNIPYRVGSLVNSTISQPLTIVSNISRVYAYFSMSERELLSIAQHVAVEGGQKNLQQRIASLPKVNFILANNEVYKHQGTLKLASGLIDRETGSASIRALFPNPNEILRSGGSGNIQIPVPRDSVILVPKKSTYEIQNKRFVYTLTGDNDVQSTEIQTMELSTKQLFVVEEGLSAGDKIVTAGMEDLENGLKIQPQNVNVDSLYQAMNWNAP